MSGYDYDLVVIGGGSGGLAASKEAAKFGKKVAVLDFVDASPQGTTWGLGGTCVNVGCIPKKLMHQAALLGEAVNDAPSFGWNVKKEGHDWSKMVQNVQDHIRSLNFGYRTQLRSEGVTYLNAKGKMIDANTIHTVDKKGREKTITAERTLIAVGGRPKYPGVPGDKECCITSDDLFSKMDAPGKTLVVGASYVALECAGFISAMGYDTTVMVRSIFLRGFDQQCAEQIVDYMANEENGHATKFLRGMVPTRFEKTEDGKVRAFYQPSNGGEETSDVFDTVVLAIGRYALTDAANLEAVGVKLADGSRKVIGGGNAPGFDEGTTVSNIFAIGDVLEGRPELTPIAMRAGRLLMRRLYDGSDIQMDYNSIATTVFTPIEYGCVGLAEEDARKEYGDDSIEVYHSYFTPLELTVPHRGENSCYAKIIVNTDEFEKIIGMHIVGVHAGEIIQGFTLAVKKGITKNELDAVVGIHPTCAEEFVSLTVTKSSGADPKKSGC